jgi:serine/threonine protein kinase
MREHCGTPAYIAPEILKDKGYQGFNADIWSAGGKIFLISQWCFLQCYMELCHLKPII